MKTVQVKENTTFTYTVYFLFLPPFNVYLKPPLIKANVALQITAEQPHSPISTTNPKENH